MQNIHTFKQMNERLDVTISSLNAETISSEQANELREELQLLEQKLSTVQAFVDARITGDNVHAFRLIQTTEVEKPEVEIEQPEHLSYVWDDGRHVEWIGGQCIVS